MTFTLPACDAGFDLVPVDQAHRVMAAGQAGHEGLAALQADLVKPLQFSDGFGVVVDPQVELQMVLVGLDAQRGGLLAALVAAGGFARGHRRQQALGQRQARGSKIGVGRGCQHLRAGQHVAGDAETVEQLVAAPVDAGCAGVGRTRADAGQHMELPVLASGIARRQRGHDLGRRVTCRQQGQAGPTVQRVHQGLRGQRAHAALAVWAERADGEESAGDCQAKAALGVARQDRPGHRVSLS